MIHAKNVFLSVFSFLFFVMMPPLYAKVIFKNPIFSGTGCPAGSVSIALDPASESMSILFDQFISKVPQVDGKNDNDSESDENTTKTSKQNKDVNHKVCNILFDVEIPEGQEVSHLSLSADFRGYTYLDKFVSGAFSSHLISVSGMGKNSKDRIPFINRKVWQGPFDREWIESGTKKINLSSNCSHKRDKILKVGFKNILVTKRKLNATEARGEIFLDTKDVVGLMKIKLHLKQCR